MRVEILVSKENSTVELTIHQPLPRVPSWIRMQTHGDRPQFWTLPAGHFFERSEGRYGPTRDLATTARSYLAGDIDRSAAEARIGAALEGWSRLTQ
jgi:hypothetical protein